MQFFHCICAVKIMFSEVNISHNTYGKCVFSSQWLILHAERSWHWVTPAIKVCSARQVTFLQPFLHLHIVTCPVSECSLCCNSSFKQVSAAPDVWSYLPWPKGSLICWASSQKPILPSSLLLYFSPLHFVPPLIFKFHNRFSNSFYIKDKKSKNK